MGKRIKEHGATVPLDNYPGNYIGFSNPDANSARGYGKLNGDAKNLPVSADGFPYDISEPMDGGEQEEFEEPLLQKKFSKKTGHYAASKPDYVSRPKDPFTYFDDATVGLAEEFIKEYVNLLIEVGTPLIRLSPRSSETDGAVTQWGTRMPGGTQFGWSSAYTFPQKKDQYEPVFSLRDLMTKHEDKTDRMHGEIEPEPEEDWKKEYGEEEYNKNFPLFWE